MTKIIMVNHRQQQQTQERQVVTIHTILFAREDDGMIIGSACMGVSQWGVDANDCETRHFITQGDAVEYVKGKCRELCGRDDIDFIQREADPMVKPASAMPQRRM